ncbi:hypothetical protein [Corynebacterium pyruviciproducens]|uniref:hypothetical protein n=1 Tax=Corynebacterium pyruviciproducens TaxID=598660 RepID=UPI0023F109BB|nr:hypothetical protein [Corynebacterium pyruviciproducens]
MTTSVHPNGDFVTVELTWGAEKYKHPPTESFTLSREEFQDFAGVIAKAADSMAGEKP